MLCDTHAHLDDEQFENSHAAVIQRAEAAGVTTIVTVGTTADSSETSVRLAQEFPAVYAAVGIQPNHVSQAAVGDWDRIVALADLPQVVALGETGLDRYWDFAPFAVQQDYFDRHLRLAQARDLPVVIHMRDCAEDLLPMLVEARRRGPLRGVLHSFTGDADTARQCLELGLYLSFAGMVTFKKSQALREVARTIPRDRILIETDSPYLAPEPQRGRRPNEPAWLVHTAACLAQVRGTDPASFADWTSRNAAELFRFPERE
jgi:TatD DNase family protein